MFSCSDEISIPLAEILQVNARLRSLNLSNNGLSDGAASSFRELISLNRTLVELFLERNYFAAKGESIMEQALAANYGSALTVLSLTTGIFKYNIEAHLKRNKERIETGQETSTRI